MPRRRSGSLSPRYAVTPLPLGVTETALEAYFHQHQLAWIPRLRALLGSLDRRVLGPPPLPVGRPPYDPLSVLSLLLYGLLVGVRSLRGLERLALTDVGAWYLGRGAQPDHSTLGKFLWQQQVFEESGFLTLVEQCLTHLRAAQAGPFLPGTCALDGSIVEAAASRHRTLQSQKARAKRAAVEAQQAESFDPKLEALWQRLQAAVEILDAREAARRAEYRKLESAVQVAPSDPEAVVQPDKTGKGCPSYHVTLLVEQHRLIVGYAADPASELHAVRPPLQMFRALYGQRIPLLLMDTGFSNFASLKEAQAASEDFLCPPKTPPREPFHLPMLKGCFDKTAFHYDAATEELTCPAGRVMKQRQRAREEGQRYQVYRGVGCESCPHRPSCTPGKKRLVKIYEVDKVKQEQRRRLQEPSEQARYALRGQLVELTLGDLKHQWHLTRFRRRGLARVTRELGWWCLAYNVWRTLRLLAPAA